MASSLNSCAGETNVSFPLRTSITDLNNYIQSIQTDKPNISADFTARMNNPNFSSDTRTSGEIDESQNAISVTYNNNSYQLLNVQLTTATHSDWIPNVNPSNPIQNKIDIIVTLENIIETQPRFVILVVPIVIDDSISVNNPYLAGLAYITNDSVYSLSSIFNGLNDYIFYTTCLAPHGDKAFVYVNIDTIKINTDLYQNLLATWTQQDLSFIQTKILDNLSPVQKNLSKLFQNVKNAKSLQEIQQQISNIQATAQTPVINSMVETWPRYSPPYDIILNVPTATISNTNVSTEGFRNRIEGFQVGSTSSGTLGSSTTETTTTTSNTSTTPTGELRCVPLDLDDAVDASGNIQLNADGSLALGEVEANRIALRNYYSANQLTYVDLIKYTSPFFAVAIVISLIYFLGFPYIQAILFPKYALPSGFITNTSSFIIYAMIFLFGGFLVGAAVAKAY